MNISVLSRYCQTAVTAYIGTSYGVFVKIILFEGIKMNRKGILLLGAIMLVSTPLWAQEIKQSTPSERKITIVRTTGGKTISKEDMAKKKAEAKAQREKIQNMLKLTDEQKEQIEAISQKSMSETKPIYKEVGRLRRQEKDSKLSEAQKKEITEKIRDLRKKVREIWKLRADEYKSVLTKEQLEIYESLPENEQFL